MLEPTSLSPQVLLELYHEEQLDGDQAALFLKSLYSTRLVQKRLESHQEEQYGAAELFTTNAFWYTTIKATHQDYHVYNVK